MSFEPKLNTNYFKAFLCAAKYLNFSEAARAAGMTQSGVSQHIQKLEDVLGSTLFNRNSKRMQLSQSGRTLLSFIEQYMQLEEKLCSDIIGSVAALSGDVSYAMPLSCLMSPHFKMLLAARKKLFPQISLQVTIADNEAILSEVSKGRLDFGFVTTEPLAAGIDVIPFCQEEYVLIAHKSVFAASKKPTDLSTLPLIKYHGFSAACEKWQAEHGFKRQTLGAYNIVGEISDLRGVTTMLQAGVGATILAKHCVAKQLESGLLEVAKGTKTVKNQIYICHQRNDAIPLRVRTVIDAFLNM